MPIRNTHRLGDWLMIDEESGHTVYRSQCRKIWDGTFRRIESFETRQPQEFIRAKSDPKALVNIRVEQPFDVASTVVPLCVGESTVLTKSPPGIGEAFVFGILGGSGSQDPGVGDMEIEAANNAGPFKVR